MPVDEEVTPEDDEISPEEIAFSQSVHETILRETEWPFEDVLREYRRIEEEFVARAGDNEKVALDFKQRISKQILGAACRAEQPHEVCRGIWEELVERGFSDHETKRIHTGIYARCCQFNGEFDAGISVLEPLIAEMEQSLKGNALTLKERKWYEKGAATSRKILDELKAGIRK
jgi:hypothetical protein